MLFAQATFQSNATGSWNNASSWTLLSGSDADGIPDANDVVTIQSSHTITLTANAFVQNITLNGTSGTRLAIGNFTLDVNGTLDGPSTVWSNSIVTTGTGELKFSGNSRALFGSNWNASPANWRVEVALNSGQTGTASTNVKVGDLKVTSGTFSVGSAGNYKELRADKGFDLTGSITIASGATLITDRCGERTSTSGTYCGSVTINGTLEVHGAYLSGFIISVNNGGRLIIAKSTPSAGLSSNPSYLSGGFFVYSSGSTLEYNEDVSSPGRITTGAELYKGGFFQPYDVVCNNTTGMKVANSFILQTNGTFYLTRGNVITSNGSTITYGSNGTLVYNGSIAQNAAVTGELEWPTVNAPTNLKINNSAADVTLQNARSINGTLNLSSGRFFTTSAAFTMNAGSSVTAVSNSSFVDGPMSKIGLTNFTFPVGKDFEYRPISVESISSSTTFTAEYFHSNANPAYDTSAKDITINHVSGCEYWMLTRTGTQNAKVRLSWDTYSCGVSVLTDLTIAQWNGTTWKDKGNGGTTGSISPGTGTVISPSLITSFTPGPITLSSTTSANPLPVTLIYFGAKYNGKSVDVNWVTSSEINSDYFSVERSVNAKDFYEISRMSGAGNSSLTHDYTAEDPHPLPGISYYRLSQTDYDGVTTHYTPVAVVAGFSKDVAFAAVLPNPFDENPVLNIQNNVPGKLELSLHDPLGKIIFENQQAISKDDHYIILPVDESLSSGLYFLNVRFNDFETTLKLLKK